MRKHEPEPEILKKACDECLFTKNRIVPDRRAEEIINKCLRQKKHFICHKGSLADHPVMCRGWFDQIEVPRLAQELGLQDTNLSTQIQVIERLACWAKIKFIDEKELLHGHGRVSQANRPD